MPRSAATLLALVAGGAATYASATTTHSPLLAGAFALALTAAAVGFTRRALFAQVAARGAVYLACVPLLFMVAGAATVMNVGALAASVAALWLARPMLGTEEALRAFHPARFRGVFLAGATASTTAAFGAALYAVVGVMVRSPIQIAFNAGLALILLVAVRALLSMRTWGLLLGAATSFALLAIAPFYGAMNAITLSLAAAPALLFWVVTLVIARTRADAPASEVDRYRIATDLDVEALAPSAGLEEEDLYPEEPAPARHAVAG